MKRSEVVDLLHGELQRIQKENVLFGRDIVCELLSFLQHKIGMKPPSRKTCAALLLDRHEWDKEDEQNPGT